MRAICSAIGTSQAHPGWVSLGPWQERRLGWLNIPAGVASVISALETLPVHIPAALTPDDHAVDDDAESVTSPAWRSCQTLRRVAQSARGRSGTFRRRC